MTPPSLSPADLANLANLKEALGRIGYPALLDGGLCATAGKLIEEIDRVINEGITPAPPYKSTFDELGQEEIHAS